MRTQPTEEQQIVWEVLAQFWVDTWYEAVQLDAFAARLANCGFSLKELDRIVYREVCGAFAALSLASFVSSGMALPDWYFPEDEARKKVLDWLSWPRFLALLNPLWIAGYVEARRFIRQDWSDLRGRVALRLGAPTA